jgi:hypothetical protein
MTLGDIVHEKKHVEEKFNVEVEKEFIDLPSDSKSPIYKRQKVSGIVLKNNSILLSKKQLLQTT